MQFDSFTFVLFFISVLVLFQLAPNWKLQKTVLLLGSYLFYAAWSPPLVVLIWISTATDFVLARYLSVAEKPGRRRLLLLVSLLVNLGLLGYFKYAEFLMDSFAALIGNFGVIYVAPDFDIILPIGISFYTFQTLSYTIDVYRKRIEATDNLRSRIASGDQEGPPLRKPLNELRVVLAQTLVDNTEIRLNHGVVEADRDFRWRNFRHSRTRTRAT